MHVVCGKLPFICIRGGVSFSFLSISSGLLRTSVDVTHCSHLVYFGSISSFSKTANMLLYMRHVRCSCDTYIIRHPKA